MCSPPVATITCDHVLVFAKSFALAADFNVNVLQCLFHPRFVFHWKWSEEFVLYTTDRCSLIFVGMTRRYLGKIISTYSVATICDGHYAILSCSRLLLYCNNSNKMFVAF